MKNKKLITATVIALLAPTLLNSQVVLAEATATADSSATTTSSSSDEIKDSTTTPEKEAGKTEESTTPEAETPATPENSTPDSTAKVEDSVSTKDIGVVDPSTGSVVINVLPTLSVRKGSTFNAMDGVSAYDNVAKKDITNQVTVKDIQFQAGATFSSVTNVDTSTEGSYWITYTVTTENGTTDATCWVMVVGDTIGMYSLEIADFTLPKNADYVSAIENRLVVKDADGTVIPAANADITVSNISTSEVGTFAVNISVLSKYNTVTTTTVNVTVVNNPIEIIAPDTTLTVGDTFDATTYATATSLDGIGNKVSLPVTLVSSNVDTTTPGEYTVVYSAQDTDGNTATKTVKVTVVAKKASVTAEDKVMYVGDKLTEDMVLGWATFENIEGYEYGFEVLGDPIQVTQLGNALVNKGTHQIRYYATNGTDTVEKTITLTVLAHPVDPAEPTDPATETPIKTNVAAPVKDIKKKTEKNLPETGSKENSMMLTSIGMTLIASVFFMKKRKENEFDLY